MRELGVLSITGSVHRVVLAAMSSFVNTPCSPAGLGAFSCGGHPDSHHITYPIEGKGNEKTRAEWAVSLGIGFPFAMPPRACNDTAETEHTTNKTKEPVKMHGTYTDHVQNR